MSGRFDAKMGAEYAALNLLKIAILFAVVSSLCLYALNVFSDSAGTAADSSSLLAESVTYTLPFFLIPGIAFVAGGFAPGDPLRLIGRMAICAYMLIILAVASGGMSYALHDILLDGTTGASAKTISLTVSPELMMMLLSFVPLLSAIDAVLEYLEPSTTDRWNSGND